MSKQQGILVSIGGYYSQCIVGHASECTAGHTNECIAGHTSECTAGHTNECIAFAAVRLSARLCSNQTPS